jgi:hypothetical protein
MERGAKLIEYDIKASQDVFFYGENSTKWYFPIYINFKTCLLYIAFRVIYVMTKQFGGINV